MDIQEDTIENNPVRKRKILKERAAIYSRVPEAKVDMGPRINGLEFLLTNERYIIDATFVVGVIPLKELTPLPCSPAFILGIINVRGKILSVVDLKPILNLPVQGITNLNRVIILKREEIELGVLVDEIIGNIAVYPDHLLTSIPTITGVQKDYLVGVTKERAIYFNIDKFLAGSNIIVDEEV